MADPGLITRIRERSDAARLAVFERHGLLDVAVLVIRASGRRGRMGYVLDSNFAVKWILEEDLSDKARRIRGELAQGIHELLAPDVFLTEAAHALMRAQRQGRITPLEVDLFMARLGLSRTYGESR